MGALDLRVMRTDTVLCTMTQETYDDWVHWEGDDSSEGNSPLIGKGWSPPFDPVSGRREYMIEVDWNKVDGLLGTAELTSYSDNFQLVFKEIVAHREELIDNQYLMWESE